MQCKCYVCTVSCPYDQQVSSKFVPSCILLMHVPGLPLRCMFCFACFEAPGTYNMYLGQAAMPHHLLNLQGMRAFLAHLVALAAFH